MRALVLSGGPLHDFATTTPMLVDLLAEAGLTSTVVAEPQEAVAALRGTADGSGDHIDLLVFNTLRWTMAEPGREELRARWGVTLSNGDESVIDGFVRSGGGMLALHTAVVCFDGTPTWKGLCGAVWRWDASSHPPPGEVGVEVTETGRHHPVTAGIESFTIVDEVYGFLDEVADLDALCHSPHGGRDHPLVWARSVGRGRVVTDLLGHSRDSFDHPAHRQLLVQAARWCSGIAPADVRADVAQIAPAELRYSSTESAP